GARWYARAMSETRERLAGELMPTEWRMLVDHFRRDGLFLVDGTVALLDVAVAVADDAKDAVQAWIESGQLRRPTREEAGRWESEEGSQFLVVIVQPFVLAQRVEDVRTEGGAEA
ncbi:MAG TPA: DUF2288 family protein, partial [Polyangiaceae bacterium LLY-WYZ-15_(1-7)]|nr:DUF2288 family protein [Polyangiaceae bacterium LLY-WYZ-15_(1-7)]